MKKTSKKLLPVEAYVRRSFVESYQNFIDSMANTDRFSETRAFMAALNVVKASREYMVCYILSCSNRLSRKSVEEIVSREIADLKDEYYGLYRNNLVVN